LPNRPWRDGRRYQQEEWEPSEALTSALGNIPLSPAADRNEDLAKLKPHLEEALGTLERLKRKRGHSEREKTRAGALRMLLGSIERVRQ
jgi:hypothetical protein